MSVCKRKNGLEKLTFCLWIEKPELLMVLKGCLFVKERFERMV